MKGEYCTVCGGMVPKAGDVQQITVDGKAVGISGLDQILKQVAEMEFSGPLQVKAALLTAVKAANYVPTKKAEAYRDALYGEYLRYMESVR
ncbi:hypothetical protein [Methanogenium cariaci]|uniref:hypothetical protein n=1 Tax=Methanogenium cariaci TaxID=2197 RepID=UPI0007830010|nr:hypothetical protein [Methanogenium cariaci]